MDDAATSSPWDLLRLTLRIVEHFDVAGQPRAALLPGQLPDDMPFDVPLPSDAVLMGSQVWEDAANIYIDTTMAPDDALDFYRRSFIGMGWRAEARERFEVADVEGREDAEDEAPHDEEYVSPDGRWTASVGAVETEEGGSSVVLYLGDREEKPGDPEEEAAARMLELLPPLPVPEGAEGWETGVGGTPESAERRIEIITDLDIEALVGGYEREIASHGWMPTEREVSIHSGWSAWEREGENGEALYLVWSAFRVPSSLPMYSVIEQVGRRERGVPGWSWSRP